MTTKLLSISAFSLVLASAAWAQLKQVDLIKEESSVSYRLVHPLHTIEATSKDVVYQIDLDPAKEEIKSVSAQVDVTTFDSGNSNRDSHAMEVIDAITFPDVTFSSTAIAQSGDSLRVAGKLTFHGVTNNITLAATTQWQLNRLDVHGAFDIGLTEFKIDRPALLMIPVEDKLSFTMVAAFSWK
jgi:polyisoprenoid-binding protein YceI